MTDTPAAPMRGSDDDIPLDRTISPIAGRLGAAGRGKALAFAGLLVGCGAVALATWSAEQPRPRRPPERAARQVVDFEPAKPVAPTLARPGPDAPGLSGSDGAVVPAIEPSAGGDARPAGASGATSRTDRPAPMMAYSRSRGLATISPPALSATSTAGQAASELDLLRRGSVIGRMSAHSVGDRNFLILAGASIPCTLQTAIDTTAAGFVTCLVGQDVYSDNGAVVLLEKGTRVLGEYRSGMRHGQARVFVLWLRAVTPGGVAIQVGSPASDALGRAGFDGVVDTHFWDRFGAALLLSVVGDASDTLRDDGRGRGARLPSDAAGIAVSRNADIAPTLRKAQGEEVAIQVSQDLDFSSVYGLQARP